MMLNCVVSNCGATICQIMDYTDDFWWFWTAFYPIIVATVMIYFLRQEFQWGWNMYRFTHIVYVSVDDGPKVVLLCNLYFFCTCIFVLYFVIT